MEADAKRKSSGRLVHGSALYKEVEGYKPTSSIPAKFETVLFTGPREKKGFGSVSRRFFDGEADGPGPGSYSKPENVEFTRDSLSKKGFGPLTSKDKRFRQRAVYSGPGPGDYSQRPPAELDQDKYFNRGKATAVFHPPVKPVKAVPHEEEVTPGPGAYRPEDTTRTGQRLEWDTSNHTHVSAFKATPHKLHLTGNLESPAPTKYNMTDPWDSNSGANKAASRTPSKAGLSSFAGRSSGSSSLTAHMNPTLYLQDPKEVSKPDTGPGPGSYELQYHEGIRSKLEKVAGKPSANFQQLEYVDRFGRALAPTQEGAYSDFAVPIPLPGAGPYQGNAHQGMSRISGPAPGVSAPFKSTVPGRAEYDLKEAGKAPGPAFYSPSAPPKRTSYHLNARKRMVA